MKKGMLIKIITALIMIAVVIPVFIVGSWLIDLLAGIVALLAAYEITAIADEKPHLLLCAEVFLVTVFSVFLSQKYLPVLLGILVLIVFANILVNEKAAADHMMYIVAVSLIMILALQGLRRIYASDDLKLWGMLYVALACYLTDTGAYFFGVFTGKHKMIPRISPNKTWEGAIGGYFSGLVVSLVFGLLVLKHIPVWIIIAGSILMPVTAEVGDLAFSAIKRRYGVKDFGSFLPGHGGILDRVDSLVFCLLLFNMLLLLGGM